MKGTWEQNEEGLQMGTAKAKGKKPKEYSVVTSSAVMVQISKQTNKWKISKWKKIFLSSGPNFEGDGLQLGHRKVWALEVESKTAVQIE